MTTDKLRDILHAVWLNGRSGKEGMSVEEALNAIAAIHRPKPTITAEPQIQPTRLATDTVTDISKVPPRMGAF